MCQRIHTCGKSLILLLYFVLLFHSVVGRIVRVTVWSLLCYIFIDTATRLFLLLDALDNFTLIIFVYFI